MALNHRQRKIVYIAGGIFAGYLAYVIARNWMNTAAVSALKNDQLAQATQQISGAAPPPS